MNVRTLLGVTALTLGVWASAQAASMDNTVLRTETVAGVAHVFESTLTHRFDDIHLKKNKNIPVHLRKVVVDDVNVPTFADVDKASQTCVIDVNLGQINTILGARGWTAEEKDFFIKFAVLHERFHCVVYNDKEAVWLPGSKTPERVTDILANQAHSSPMTMLTPHPAAYEFVHEELADGMALLALLQDNIKASSLDPHHSIGQNLPPPLKKIVTHILQFRLQSSLKEEDAHGTLRMLDFILQQPAGSLHRPLGEWYTPMREAAGHHLMDAYKRAGMDAVLDVSDMWYDTKTSAITMSLSDASQKTFTYKEKIVAQMRQQLANNGIMIHDAYNTDGINQLDKSTVTKIDAALQHQTLGWFDGLEWNKRVDELQTINEAYRHYQSKTPVDLDALKEVSAQEHYMMRFQ